MTESSKGVLLVVDDEPLKRVTLQIELSEAGYTVLEAADAISALKQLDARPVDIVITDVRMPEIDGMQFLEEIKARFPKTPVILMTAFGSVDAAVEAIKRGAYDYIAKPFPTDMLLEKIERLLAGRSAGEGPGPGEPEILGPLVGRSYPLRRLFEQIRAVVDNERPVMIQGEAGTCRERVAEAIHRLSRRSQGPMVKFSCAASDSETVDGELFGFYPEAAGGRALAPKLGRFELAAGGTLFLDDVDALAIQLQGKLLLALEEGLFERAGNADRVSVDVRLICATDKNLRPLAVAGRFREDLYYRLDAIHLSIPPLRERREDVPILARHYLRNRADGGGGEEVPSRISPHAMDALVNYHWPGNVRELEHVIERAVAFSDGEEIRPQDILLPADRPPEEQEVSAVADGAAGLTQTIAGVERTLIDAALRRAAGNQARAAQFLGIPRTTLRDKMAKYGMVGRPGKREGEAAS